MVDKYCFKDSRIRLPMEHKESIILTLIIVGDVLA